MNFIQGLIIGFCAATFLFLLFKDLILKKIIANSVPMIKNNNSDEIISLEEFKEDMYNHINNDLICSYKILILLKNTINMILTVYELDNKLREALTTKLDELTRVISDYKEMFEEKGIDIDYYLFDEENDK